MSWQKIPFNSLFKEPSRNGIYKTAEFHGRGVKIVNMGELFSNDRISNQKMERVEISESEKRTVLLQEGDLLFARRSLVESGAGKVAIVDNLIEDTTFESSVIRIRLDKEKCLPLFYLYWFKSYNGRSVIYPLITGVNVKGIRGSELANVEVDFPPITTQKRVVDVLSAYDSLIENNHKQIRLLEEAAQRLYKEWFVDLRFPGYENSIFENDIPCGWEFKKFSDLAEIVMGTSPKSEFYNTNHEGIPFHQGVGSYGKRFVNDDVYTTVAIKTATANSILISVRAPVGRVNITRNRIAIGRGLAAINCKNNCQNFLYYLIKAFFFKDDIVGNGSIFSSISKQELCDLKFLVPEERLIRQFNEKVKSIDNKIDILDKQILLLKEARDRLLPKLMNGEIEL